MVKPAPLFGAVKRIVEGSGGRNQGQKNRRKKIKEGTRVDKQRMSRRARANIFIPKHATPHRPSSFALIPYFPKNGTGRNGD